MAATETGSGRPIDLSKYKPGPLPPSRLRSASAPPCARRCDNEEYRYMVMSTWPAPNKCACNSADCEFGQQLDVFPPENAPLGTRLQAYALRWGVWVMDVKEPALRAQLLDKVCEKVKEATITLEREGNYTPRTTSSSNAVTSSPNDVQTLLLPPKVSFQGSDRKRSPKSTKKTETARDRKIRLDLQRQQELEQRMQRRMQTSRAYADFPRDTNESFAMRQHELYDNRLTIEMIKDREEKGDLSAGKRYEKQLQTELKRKEVNRQDCLKPGFPKNSTNYTHRDLLKYAIFAAQQARFSIPGLERTKSGFRDPLKISNTQRRIDDAKEKENLYMALATELALKKENAHCDPITIPDVEDEDEPILVEPSPSPVTKQQKRTIDSRQAQNDRESGKRRKLNHRVIHDSDDDDHN